MRRLTLGTLALAAALIALPVSGIAQTPPTQPPTEPPSQPPTAQPPATEQQPAGQPNTQSAAEHLAKARSALNAIDATSATGRARTQLTELKRRMTSLETLATAAPAKPLAGRASASAKNWATEVAAVDRILTELTTPTSSSDPAVPTGTTGTTGRSPAKAAIAIDDATRAKLLEVRTHINAFAAAMSGTSVEPTAGEPAAARPDATTTAPPSSVQPPAAATPATMTMDKDAARRHLTEARDVLSQLTQLPEAAQLAGDTRTQVSQLITNFNELITSQTEWRDAYAKVKANLTALVGEERTDEANVPPPATGTAGAVGTSGNATLDPKIREKLIEFRTKLSAFERAAGSMLSSAFSEVDSCEPAPPPRRCSRAPSWRPLTAAPHHQHFRPPTSPGTPGTTSPR